MAAIAMIRHAATAPQIMKRLIRFVVPLSGFVLILAS